MTPDAYVEAIAHVKARVTASRTSFSAGMAVLPKERREAMYALYAFCRAVDDIADDSPSPDIAAKGLAAWRVRISDLFKSYPSDPITTALMPAVHKFNLAEKDFQEIIDGMVMDSTAIVAPGMDTLDLYCDRVASAVGRISIHIFGDGGVEGMKVAHHLGRALQLTNILRDLAEDAERGRLYLPKEILEKHGIASRDPKEVLRLPALPLVCRDLATLAREHYEHADAAIRTRPALAMRPARLMRAYYGAIFDRLVEEDWRDPFTRVSVPKWKKLLLVIQGMF